MSLGKYIVPELILTSNNYALKVCVLFSKVSVMKINAIRMTFNIIE